MVVEFSVKSSLEKVLHDFISVGLNYIFFKITKSLTVDFFLKCVMSFEGLQSLLCICHIVMSHQTSVSQK